jgi:O-antigen ligase
LKELPSRVAWGLLWILVFSMPWEKSLWIPHVGTISQLLGIPAFAAWAVEAFRRGPLRRPNAVLIAAALLATWFAATYFWSLDPAATLVRVKTFAELTALLWLIWDQCRGAARQRHLLGAYVFGSAAASGIAFWRYAHQQQTYYLRYAATGFDPNDFGLVLALAVAPALYLMRRESGRLRWFAAAALTAVIPAILLTASRTAMVAAFVALIFGLITWRQSDLAYRLTAGLAIAGLALGPVLLAPAAQRTRLQTLPAELNRGTFHGRTVIWKTGLKVFKQHPLRGVGSGAYPKAVEPWLGRPGVPGAQYVAHNTFLSVLVETGIVGLALFALLGALLVTSILAMPMPERALWAVVAAVWVTGVSTLTWEQYKPTWLIMALITTDWARSYWPANEKS